MKRKEWLGSFLVERLSIWSSFNISMKICVLCTGTMMLSLFFRMCCELLEKKGNCRKHFQWKCLWLLFLNVWHIFFSLLVVKWKRQKAEWKKRRLFLNMNHKQTDFVIVKIACLRQYRHTNKYDTYNIYTHTYWHKTSNDSHMLLWYWIHRL